MANIKKRVIKLLQNKNCIRAVVIYGASVLIGLTGLAVSFFAANIAVGWYIFNCAIGLCGGIALALLNNGHKKPVTFKSTASTVGMTLFFAFITFLFGSPIFALVLGWGLSMLGGTLGLWFCEWENKKALKQEMKEMIEIYNEKMKKIGVMEKYEAHDKNQWHKNAHIWVTDGNNVLVQRRASNKKVFPNKWDISVAGHFDIGDTPFRCAVREWAEELGLPWEFGEVEANFMKPWKMWDGWPVYEFVYFFFLKGKPDIDLAKLQGEEVAKVKWLPFEEFKEKIKTDEFCPYGDEYWELVVQELEKLLG